jgi:hypothetical protein
MAGILAHTSSGEVSLSASTPKTMLQLVAAANHRVLIKSYSVSFKGVSSTDPPVLVQLVRQTSAGTSSAATVEKNNEGDDETLQSSAVKDCTAEPTTGNVIIEAEVHPQSGWHVFLPLGQEIVVKGGGRVGIRCAPGAAPATLTAVACIDFEE